MKTYSTECKGFRFVCDRCRAVAGEDKDEREALKMAQKVADMQGWTWKHPHWQLYCPLCQ